MAANPSFIQRVGGRIWNSAIDNALTAAWLAAAAFAMTLLTAITLYVREVSPYLVHGLVGAAIASALIFVASAIVRDTAKPAREKVAKELRDKNEAYSQAISQSESLTEQVRVLAGERDGARQAYQVCKHSFTTYRFERYADDTRAWNVHVTIRFVDKEDFGLVTEIERLIRDQAKWKVSLDQSNSPVLRPSKQYKVMLVTKHHDRFMHLRDFLDVEDGHLLSCRVGVRTNGDDDHSHLIIEVLPTIKGMMH